MNEIELWNAVKNNPPIEAIKMAFKLGQIESINNYNEKIKECCSVVGCCDFDDLDRIAEELKEQSNE